MTRQIAEAVRIDLRGEHVLNSKSEYSRCRIPRLVIDQDDWRVYKKKEKAELEPKAVETVLEINEEGEETTIVLEEEVEFGMIEKESKIEKKRKSRVCEQPAKKRKKFENIMNWRDEEDDAEDDGQEQRLVGGCMQRVQTLLQQ